MILLQYFYTQNDQDNLSVLEKLYDFIKKIKVDLNSCFQSQDQVNITIIFPSWNAAFVWHILFYNVLFMRYLRCVIETGYPVYIYLYRSELKCPDLSRPQKSHIARLFRERPVWFD